MSKTVLEMAREVGAHKVCEFDPERSIDLMAFETHELERLVELARADERAKLAEQPAPLQQEPCGWQFFQDGKWHNGMETNDHRKHTEAAGVPVRDVYPSPQAQPSREWVGLTDAEKHQLFRKSHELPKQPAPAAPELVPVPDDWTEWPGGDRPVPGATRVLVKFRDENIDYEFARAFDWNHGKGINDIVAYRVATATPQAPKENQS